MKNPILISALLFFFASCNDTGTVADYNSQNDAAHKTTTIYDTLRKTWCCVIDSLHKDSTVIRYAYKDSIVYRRKDSVIINRIYKDSTITRYLDSLVYKLKDSIVYTPLYVRPELKKFLSDSNQKVLKIIIQHP